MKRRRKVLLVLLIAGTAAAFLWWWRYPLRIETSELAKERGFEFTLFLADATAIPVATT